MRWAGKKPTADEWRGILERHAAWLRGEMQGERADLTDAVLTRADLTGAVLTRADLTRADLTGAVLTRADLTGAVLTGADLTDAVLTRADLTDADLTRADLTGADLTDAVLTRAVLTRADLTGAVLTRADLTGAVLTRADLTGAVLTRADLTGAEHSALVIARTRILPEGALIGWKKCRDGVLVKLLIPADAKRSHAFGRKCRAEYADVLEVIGAEVGKSLFAAEFEYRAGQRVQPDEWNPDWTNECSGGIHFFITREEAEVWN
jgi:hypothetical protein